MKTISRILVSGALLFGAAIVSMAQETVVSEDTEKVVKEEVASSRSFEVGSFRDNWFLGIGGGVNQYLGEHDRQMKFINRLAPAMDVYFGKWFTPALGFRIAYSGGETYGATNLMTGMINSTGTPVATDYLKNSFLDANPDYKGDGTDHHALYWQKGHVWNLHVDFMLNLMNLIGGYKERVYNLSPYFGIGYARSYAHLDLDNQFCNNRVNGLVGLLNSFRLCDALDLNVDFRGVLVPQDFEGELGTRPGGGETYESEGYLTATLGLAYKFKPRGWKQSETKTVYETKTVTVLDEAALNEALARAEGLEKELEDAKKNVKTEIQKEVITEIVESLLSPEIFIVFDFNKSDLSSEAKVSLSNLAKLLNATDSIVYNIAGYADQQTGSAEHNMKLSQERAQRVYDFLVNEHGVAPKKLSMEAKGGVDAMFYGDNRLSRAVILTLQK